MNNLHTLLEGKGCYKHIRSLVTAGANELLNEGFNETEINMLRTIWDVANNLIKEEKAPESIQSPADVYKLSRTMVLNERECLKVITLNSKHNVLSIKQISEGTADVTICHPRDVFREAILRNATSVICVHNHPSGDPTPSRMDADTTKRLIEAGNIIGIHLRDFVVVGTQGFKSIQEVFPEIAFYG